MTKMLKRRITSSVTALAIIFSFGAASALDAYDPIENEQDSVKLDYDYIFCD